MSVSTSQGRDRAGIAFALLAVVIWAAWLPATRVAISDGLGPIDIALLRYGVPALMLLPVCLRTGLLPRGVPVSLLLAMFCWGAPFVLLMSFGMARASVVHTAALVPCMMPVIAAFASRAFYGEAIPRQRRIGITFIMVDAMLVLVSVYIGDSMTDLSTIGLLLLASAGWAAYSVAFRRSGLTAVQAAAVVFAWSTIMLIPLALMHGTMLPTLPTGSLLFHILAQGVLSGFVATIAYGLAIGRLGVPRAASFSVLVPVLATILAVVWIGEMPSALDAVALCIGTLGVAVINGVLSFKR